MKTIKHTPDKKLLFKISAISALVLCHILMLLLIWKRMRYLLDSDMASELLLGRILCDENSLLTRSWFYSTELRVLNTQLIYALFFHFTGSWRAVRILSTLVLHAAMSLSTVHLCRRAGCGEYGCLTAAALLLPLSVTYFLIVDIGCYYIPHIAISFLTIAMVYSYADSEKPRRRVTLAVSVLFSFAAGLGGARQLITTYLPLIAAAALLSAAVIYRKGAEDFRRSSLPRYAVISAADLLSGCIGYIVNNRVLSRIYHFKSWNEVNFVTIRKDLETRLINDMLISFGFTSGQLSLKTLICNCACAVIVFVTLVSAAAGLKKGADEKHRFLSVFFVCDILVLFALYLFTDMDYTGRYVLPVTVFAFPLAAAGLKSAEHSKLPGPAVLAAAAVFFGAVFVRGWLECREMYSVNRTGELVAAAEQLEEAGYRSGYASFWNANVITELTDGSIEMYAWRSTGANGAGMDGLTDPDDVTPWLQAVSHTAQRPEGKVFILLSRAETDSSCWKDALQGSDIIFSSGTYTAFGFDSCDEMRSVLMGDN